MAILWLFVGCGDGFDEVSQIISGHTDDCQKVVTDGYYNLASFDGAKVFQFDIKWKERSIQMINIKYNILV